MDDEAAKVDQYPPVVVPPLDPKWLGPIQDHQLFLYLFDDGPDLAGRIATRDYEIFGNGDHVAHFNDRRIAPQSVSGSTGGYLSPVSPTFKRWRRERPGGDGLITHSG